MDANWRSTQGTKSSDWRTQMHPDSRQRVVNRIMETLKRHLPFSGQDGLYELRKIAERFEEKTYTAATSQPDYLRKISLKMLTMEGAPQTTIVNPMQSNAGGPSNKPIDSGIPVLSQVPNPGQSHAIPVPYNAQQANNVQLSMQPMLQQHSQSVVRQQQQHTSINNQQQIPISQQQISALQQQQQLLPALQSNVTSMQHPQLVGQQNNVDDKRQRLRLLVGENKNLTQQLINMQNHLANWHQQQSVSSVPGLQQQMLVTQSGNSSEETNQHSEIMLQQSQQQSQQNVTNLLQPQPAQLQQQLGLLQPPNPLPRDMQLRLHASSSLLQQQNVLDQQELLYQSQRALQNSSSTSLDLTPQTEKSGGDDWQEEVYQKIKSMKELYLPELTEMNQKIAVKLQQSESLPHHSRSEQQLQKLKMFKTMLERLIAFLQVSKGNIVPSLKDRLASYEKQIINFISTNRPKKAMSTMQPGQLPPPYTHSASQPQSQLTQLQSHENQMNSQEKKVRKSPEPPKEPVFSCPICMDPLVEEMSTRCGHIFCKNCIKTAINAQGKCPTCRKRANVKELIRIFLPSTT